MPNPSNDEPNNVNCPSRLSSLVSAICFAAPELLFIASVNLLKSSSLELTIASIPDIPSCPASIAAY